MSRSTRGELRPQSAAGDDSAAATDETTLDYRHPALGAECWSNVRETRSVTRNSAMAVPSRPALRLHRVPRPHGRHCPRPSHPADARLLVCDGEFVGG